jgi:hypothetical protein
MCKPEDYRILHLSKQSQYITDELQDWHETYLTGNLDTVVDLDAGEGETALFFLSHGCRHYIGVEADPEEYALALKNRKVLLKKFPGTTIEFELGMITKLKVDIEGGEEEMVMETHFPHKLVKSPLLPHSSLLQRIFMTVRRQHYYTLKRTPKSYETLLNCMSEM